MGSKEGAELASVSYFHFWYHINFIFSKVRQDLGFDLTQLIEKMEDIVRPYFVICVMWW